MLVSLLMLGAAIAQEPGPQEPAAEEPAAQEAEAAAQEAPAPSSPTPAAETPKVDAPFAWERTLSAQRCEVEAFDLSRDVETPMNAVLLLKDKEGTGSAVIISPDGVVLTAAHVVGKKEKIKALTQSGEELNLEVVRTHPFYDVAVLRIVDGPEQLPCLPLAQGKATLGTSAYVLGSPAGEELSFSVSRGIVSGRREIGGKSFLQTDASVNPGNSGGPMVNEQGQVMGIVSWKVAATEYEGLSFAVPAMRTLEFLNLEFSEQTDLSEPGERIAPGTAMGDENNSDYQRGLTDGREAAKSAGFLLPTAAGGAAGCATGFGLALCGAPVICLAPGVAFLPVETPDLNAEQEESEDYARGYNTGYQGQTRLRRAVYTTAGAAGGLLTGAVIAYATGANSGLFSL